jgi:predicted HTH transcriptional regulator
MFRIDIPDYGDDALRESTMNAFIHRDFTAPESVVMQLHPQRFFVSNPWRLLPRRDATKPAFP